MATVQRLASLPTRVGVPPATLSMFSHRLTRQDLCDDSHLSIGDGYCDLSVTTAYEHIDIEVEGGVVLERTGNRTRWRRPTVIGHLR